MYKQIDNQVFKIFAHIIYMCKHLITSILPSLPFKPMITSKLYTYPTTLSCAEVATEPIFILPTRNI